LSRPVPYRSPADSFSSFVVMSSLMLCTVMNYLNEPDPKMVDVERNMRVKEGQGGWNRDEAWTTAVLLSNGATLTDTETQTLTQHAQETEGGPRTAWARALLAWSTGNLPAAALALLAAAYGSDGDTVDLVAAKFAQILAFYSDPSPFVLALPMQRLPPAAVARVHPCATHWHQGCLAFGLWEDGHEVDARQAVQRGFAALDSCTGCEGERRDPWLVHAAAHSASSAVEALSHLRERRRHYAHPNAHPFIRSHCAFHHLAALLSARGVDAAAPAAAVSHATADGGIFSAGDPTPPHPQVQLSAALALCLLVAHGVPTADLAAFAADVVARLGEVCDDPVLLTTAGLAFRLAGDEEGLRTWHSTLLRAGGQVQVEVGEALAGFRVDKQRASTITERTAFRLVGASGEQREAVQLALEALAR